MISLTAKLCEAPFINGDAQGMHWASGSADAFINDKLPNFVYACSLANPARLSLLVMQEEIALKIAIIFLKSSTIGFSSRVMEIAFYFPSLFE